MAALGRAGEPVLFPCHPRTARVLDSEGIALAPNLRQLPPVGYLDMLTLETHARMIATDSGGVQREAYHLGVPCLTLRDETEWRETLDTGWNRLVGADEALILEGLRTLIPPPDRPPIFGDGHAGELAVSSMERWWFGRSDGGSRASA
jgi:UDP-N-acetylglucosamine 2-epimerase